MIFKPHELWNRKLLLVFFSVVVFALIAYPVWRIYATGSSIDQAVHDVQDIDRLSSDIYGQLNGALAYPGKSTEQEVILLSIRINDLDEKLVSLNQKQKNSAALRTSSPLAAFITKEKVFLDKAKSIGESLSMYENIVVTCNPVVRSTTANTKASQFETDIAPCLESINKLEHPYDKDLYVSFTQNYTLALIRVILLADQLLTASEKKDASTIKTAKAFLDYANSDFVDAQSAKARYDIQAPDNNIKAVSAELKNTKTDFLALLRG